MKTTSTKDVSTDRLKFLIYGQPGVGKTRLAATITEPVLLISAEAGLLSLSGFDIPVIDISTDDNGEVIAKELRMAKLLKIFNWLNTDPEPRKKYKWIFVDSLTEVSQNLVENLNKVYPSKDDGYNLWGDYAKQSSAMIKGFRDIPYYNIVFTALETEDKDDNNRRFIRVDMQGKIGKRLPGFFDEVFYFHMDTDGKRHLLTATKDNVVAKDRSGTLDTLEPPCLRTIAEKIRKGRKNGGRNAGSNEKSTQAKAQPGRQQVKRTDGSNATKPNSNVSARTPVRAKETTGASAS